MTMVAPQPPMGENLFARCLRYGFDPGVPCLPLGCVGSMHVQDDLIFFRHDDSDGRVAMIEIPESRLLDTDFDIWGEIVKPWIERLHADEGQAP